ncbi:hypothetical protein EZV73_09770 [Acidaminobacter sp. JC074]|uniref:hypothetical protein n=1 Tax=Acidaminobacter sp. JC074 TaxID=2530199 RepID=UPI001F1151B6|nr:hypothetical protein [Acidaminobacter sp. JC074]MCH4887861.1 hypothetical protein [Acidaminobacter sp. JC074]
MELLYMIIMGMFVIVASIYMTYLGIASSFPEILKSKSKSFNRKKHLLAYILFAGNTLAFYSVFTQDVNLAVIAFLQVVFSSILVWRYLVLKRNDDKADY